MFFLYPFLKKIMAITMATVLAMSGVSAETRCGKLVYEGLIYDGLRLDKTYAANAAGDILDGTKLYAISACLMDADSGRVLFGKNENEVRAMASTTKIMTLTIALEYGNPEDIVTVSPYAASMPDVQLNMAAGEQYYLKDLCYAMMLESFNDVAVAIAEHIGQKYLDDLEEKNAAARTRDESEKCVKAFANLMNGKAQDIGCSDTYFITPNGLDAEDENGKHSSTAYEMALITSYAIKNQSFKEIIATKDYQFGESNGKRNCHVYNKDAFLEQMQGAFGVKTGFTGDAGYCFVGALQNDGRTFVSVVLGCGWPGNKTYKWKDTRKLMQYGIDNFYYRKIFEGVIQCKDVAVINGQQDKIGTRVEGNFGCLLKEDDDVSVIYEITQSLVAPVVKNQNVGRAVIYVNNQVVASFNIKTESEVMQKDFRWYLKQILMKFLLENYHIM